MPIFLPWHFRLPVALGLSRILIKINLFPWPAEGLWFKTGRSYSFLCESLIKGRSYALQCKPNQAKTLSHFAKIKTSLHYLKSGDSIRITDWRFIHIAQLNLLHLNATNPDNPPKKKQCRHCSNSFEVPLHVLCHCKLNMQLINERHNQIVDRFHKNTSGTCVLHKKNQPLEGSTLRLDLALIREHDRFALILDVACTFGDGPGVFDKIRQEKAKMCSEVNKSLRNGYKNVSMEAVVLGALESWAGKTTVYVTGYVPKNIASCWNN